MSTLVIALSTVGDIAREGFRNTVEAFTMQTGSVIIIDDDTDYCCLLQVALLEAGVANPIQIVADSCEALLFLQRVVPASGVPALVLLDLKMPKVSGLEVLRWIRSQRPLAQVPVVVFTGVKIGTEPGEALSLGAASVHIKPFSYRELVDEARALREQYLAAHGFQQAA